MIPVEYCKLPISQVVGCLCFGTWSAGFFLFEILKWDLQCDMPDFAN